MAVVQRHALSGNAALGTLFRLITSGWLMSLALGAALGCYEAPAPAQRLSDDRIFVMLGALGSLLEFPVSQEALNRCAKTSDERCLTQYDEARKLVAVLFDKGRAAALTRTLAAVDSNCRSARPSEGTISPWQSCRGAMNALYFFASDAEDQAILMHLGTLDAQVLHNALVESHGYAGDWVSNRPERTRWKSFVDSVSALRDQRIGDVFTAPAPPHSGISLLAPRPTDSGRE